MNFDSRTIVINDYLYIIGGINKETEAPSDDFYRFSISKREIHRCERMSIPRTGAAVTFIDYCIYVIGGKYQYATAEMYNTVT